VTGRLPVPDAVRLRRDGVADLVRLDPPDALDEAVGAAHGVTFCETLGDVGPAEGQLERVTAELYRRGLVPRGGTLAWAQDTTDGSATCPVRFVMTREAAVEWRELKVAAHRTAEREADGRGRVLGRMIAGRSAAAAPLTLSPADPFVVAFAAADAAADDARDAWLDASDLVRRMTGHPLTRA